MNVSLPLILVPTNFWEEKSGSQAANFRYQLKQDWWEQSWEPIKKTISWKALKENRETAELSGKFSVGFIPYLILYSYKLLIRAAFK